MTNEKALMAISVFAIIVFYLIFQWGDEKSARDEREKLIHLRALEIMHNITTWVFSMLTLAWVFVFYTKLDSLYFMVIMFASWHLSYPLAKIYLRQRM